MNIKDYYYHKQNTYKISGSRLKHILELIKELNLNNGAKILDIGCGGGDLLANFTNKNYIKYGVDISQLALDKAKNNLDFSYCFNLEGDNWPNSLMLEGFDLIIVSEVLEHLFDTHKLLNKINKLLKDDGKIIITIPNILFWKNRLKILFGKFEYQNKGLMDYGHIRFLTFATAKKAFEQAGLRIIKENHVYPNFDKRKLSFIGRLFPGFFAYQLIFLLKKK